MPFPVREIGSITTGIGTRCRPKWNAEVGLMHYDGAKLASLAARQFPLFILIEKVVPHEHTSTPGPCYH